MKYRKKPVVIEANQWLKDGDHPKVYFRYNRGDGVWITCASDHDGATPVIDTLEGFMFVTRGDWIICGVQGEHYPCKPDIFEQTYEAVE